MLYLIYGNNEEVARKELHKLLGTLYKKRPDAEVFRMTSEDYDPARLEEFIVSQGLFERKYIVLLDKLFETATAREDVLQNLKEMEASESMFIIFENALLKSVVSKIERRAVGIKECSRAKVEQKKDYTFTNVFGGRNKKSLWIAYRQALSEGKSAEELHGLLLWQLKSMFLALSASSADEAGQNPFVYRMAKGYANNYSREELVALSSKLIEALRSARRGEGELETGLEKLILEL